jgi:hypothetical protein
MKTMRCFCTYALQNKLFPQQILCILHIASSFVRPFRIHQFPIKKWGPPSDRSLRIMRHILPLRQIYHHNLMQLTRDSNAQVGLNSNQTIKELNRYKTRVAILQHELNHTEKDLRKYQTRVEILQHELNQRAQELEKYHRRIQILQDLVSIQKSQSQINDFEEDNRRLSEIVEQLRSKIFFLEHQTLKSVTEENSALQHVLQKKDALLKQEREKSEQDQRNWERDLYNANQEVLKVESSLFAMEKEIKARQQQWDQQELVLQRIIEKERNFNRRIKEKLRATRNERQPVFRGSNATQLSNEAGTLQSEHLKQAAIDMEEKWRKALQQNLDWEQSNSKQRAQLREQEETISELKSTIHLQDRNIRQTEEKLEKVLLEMAASSTKNAREIRMIQQEKEKLEELLKREKEYLPTKIDIKSLQKEEKVTPTNDSMTLKVSLTEKRNADQKQGILEEDSFSGIARISKTARVQNFFRWLKAKATFKRFRKFNV